MKRVSLMINYLLLSCIHKPINGNVNTFQTSMQFTAGNRTTTCGLILSENDVETHIICSSRCLLQGACKGFLFNANNQVSERCKLVSSQAMKSIKNTFPGQHGYTEFSLYIPPTEVCNNIGISVSNPTGWRSGCPKVYFPLDSSSEGTALGPNSSTFQFVSGKVNNSLNLPNPNGNIAAYLRLGTYSSTSYCFPDPERCQEGVSFAFWLKIFGVTETQGFLTTHQWNGPGFQAAWEVGTGFDNLVFKFWRASGGKQN